jgi:Fe2+ or Zn2+ uptake regulation protein
MNGRFPASEDRRCTQHLAVRGFRFTPQRRRVYSILTQKRDHPTANEVYLRAKQAMPDISMATVYNCLDALVQSGLVRQVTLDRSASRYCPNMRDHSHFYCDGCGAMFDIPYAPDWPRARVRVPVDFQVTQYELSIRGFCPACARPRPSKPRATGKSPALSRR